MHAVNVKHFKIKGAVAFFLVVRKENGYPWKKHWHLPGNLWYLTLEVDIKKWC